jgi:hypothetical protein
MMTHRGNLSLEVVRGEKRIVTQDCKSLVSLLIQASAHGHTAGIVVLFCFGFDKRHLVIYMKLDKYQEI